MHSTLRSGRTSSVEGTNKSFEESVENLKLNLTILIHLFHRIFKKVAQFDDDGKKVRICSTVNSDGKKVTKNPIS